MPKIFSMYLLQYIHRKDFVHNVGHLPRISALRVLILLLNLYSV